MDVQQRHDQQIAVAQNILVDLKLAEFRRALRFPCDLILSRGCAVELSRSPLLNFRRLGFSILRDQVLSRRCLVFLVIPVDDIHQRARVLSEGEEKTDRCFDELRNCD